jgi:hypothetical protein
MAINIFAQDANPISGRGYLVVIPMSATSATFETFTTPSITVSAIKAVTDGSLVVTTDGTAETLTGLDFSAISNVDDIVSILSGALKNCFVSNSAGQIVFTSKKAGSAGSVVLTSGSTGTDLADASLFNVAGGSTTAGTNASGETLAEAITRARPLVRFTGVVSALIMGDTEAQAVASLAQADDIIWINSWFSKADIDGICKTIKDASQTHTRCLVYTQGVEKAKLYEAAYAGRAFSVNFEGSEVSETMNLKTLANVTPDMGISQNDFTKAKTNGVDLYVSYEGIPAVLSSGGNTFFDVVYENMAFKFYAQNYMLNALKTTNTKIPQTESGVAVLENALAQAFILFVRNGVFAAGKWNSSQTFGDPETFRDNIANQGWYIYHTPIAQQSQSEREQRIAPLIQGAGKRAGAIHEADVLIIVEE